MIKLQNPLNYPICVLAGSVVLVVGVRFFGLSNGVVLPAAAAATTASAVVLNPREPDSQKLLKQQLRNELQVMQNAGKSLVKKAEILCQEANQLLTGGSFQLELLVAIQEACDRAIELPVKLDQFARRLQGVDSLLSKSELQQQLLEVQAKQRTSSGVARQHLDRLADSLQRNIQLAGEEQNLRIAQIVNLYTLIQDSAGVFQQLLNKLRTADFSNSEQVEELRSLSAKLNRSQEKVDILVSK